MQKFKNNYLASMNELKSTRNIALCGLMGALAVVLEYTTSIAIGPTIKIGFSGYPNRIIEFMLGPYAGAIFGAALDILKYFLKPDGGAFFFGYTLNVMVAGIIFGTMLHKKPVRIWRIFTAEFLVKLVVNCGLNTLWISMLGGKAFMAVLPPRIIKNAIMLPIDTMLLFFVLTFVQLIINKAGFSDNKI